MSKCSWKNAADKRAFLMRSCHQLELVKKKKNIKKERQYLQYDKIKYNKTESA